MGGSLSSANDDEYTVKQRVGAFVRHTLSEREKFEIERDASRFGALLSRRIHHPFAHRIMLLIETVERTVATRTPNVMADPPRATWRVVVPETNEFTSAMWTAFATFVASEQFRGYIAERLSGPEFGFDPKDVGVMTSWEVATRSHVILVTCRV